MGMLVEDRSSHFTGDVVRWSAEGVTLQDRHDYVRHFGWKPGGFLLEGRPVTLVRPGRATATQRHHGVGLDRRRPGAPRWLGRAGSGSRASTTPSCSSTCGVTICASSASSSSRCTGPTIWRLRCAGFGPATERRLGVLLDHLVAGSKESRIAATVTRSERADHRAPVRRRVGRHPAEGARPRRVARRPLDRRAVEGGHVRSARCAVRRASGRSCATG